MRKTDSKPGISKWLDVLVCALAVLSSSSFAYDNECIGESGYCPEVYNSTGGKLAFVDNYPRQPMLQTVNTCFYVTCCTGKESQVNTTWYRWIPDWQRWCHLQENGGEDCVDWNSHNIVDDGQTLTFTYPGIISDSGMYKCIATDGRTMINRTFDVRVVDCKENVTEVRFSIPANAQAELGSRYTQKCQGDFGCKGALTEDNLAWWSYIDETGLPQNVTVGKHGRYSVHEHISEDGMKKAAVLTIDGVAKEDFSRLFICQLKMGNQPAVGFNFTLGETENKTTLEKFIPLIIVLSVLAGICVAVSLLTYLCCLPVADFTCKSAVNRLPKREAWHEYDVMLISREESKQDDEDAQVMQAMTDTLTNKGFSVYPPILSGARGQQFDDVAKCVSVIFVIGTSFLTPDDEYLAGFDRFFANSAESKTIIIFVSTQPMSRTEWARLSAEYKKLYEHAPKVCPTITWPGERPSFRLKCNFWCKVKSFLPKPQPGNARHNDAGDPSQTEQTRLTGDASATMI